MDGGAWRATVHGVTKSQTRLSDLHPCTPTEAQGGIWNLPDGGGWGRGRHCPPLSRQDVETRGCWSFPASPAFLTAVVDFH